MNYQLLQGDNRQVLRTLPAQSVHCIVTSPPYFGLRDYGTATWEGGDPTCDHHTREVTTATLSSTLGGGKKTTGHQQEGYKDACGKCGATRVDQQIGLEATPELFVAELVSVFRECWRVLRDDGTLWVNLGSSYSTGFIESEEYQLRDDLTQEEITYVYRELAEYLRAKSEAMRAMW